MNRYSQSGDFGEVEHFVVNFSTAEFCSLNRIVNAGWHKVNDLYLIDRPEGLEGGVMLFTLSGRGKITVNQKTCIAKSGSIAVIPPRCAHSYGCMADEEWEFYWVRYVGEHANKCSVDIVKNKDFLFQFDVKMIQLCFLSYIENKAKGIERELDDSVWLERFFQILLKKSSSLSHVESDSPIVKEMLMFIEQSTDSDFSLDSLAKQYHYSKEHLIRIFQRAMGISPYKYWILLKLNRSCYELEKNERSIAEIAKECGYKHVGSYSVEFKKSFHMSPQEYRDMFQFKKVKASGSSQSVSD